MKIEVTQEDIDAGMVSAHSCPIALAANRIVGDNMCLVGPNVISIKSHKVPFTLNDHESFYWEYNSTKLPPEARKFVSDFDDHQPVEPFSFEIDYANL